MNNSACRVLQNVDERKFAVECMMCGSSAPEPVCRHLYCIQRAVTVVQPGRLKVSQRLGSTAQCTEMPGFLV